MHLPDKEVLAFCHIEKAAGTSLIHVLRRLFATGYVDARPLLKGHGPFFSRADFQLFSKLYPRITCIGGHSVVPHSDLANIGTRLRFITLLREPVSRVVSHYKFWVQRMGSRFDPDDFLDHPVASNFQVKKIAGNSDIAKAKKVILEKFLLAGTIEEFDDFLVLLSRKLCASSDKFLYQPRNISDDKQLLHLPDGFQERVQELNTLDDELYSWVRNELAPKYVEDHGEGFAGDVARFKQLLTSQGDDRVSSIPGNLFRIGYAKPVTGVIRVLNGIPYSGSYID